MVYGNAKALYDDDDDVHAPTHGVVGQVVDDAQADNDVWAVDARGVVLVDDVREWTVPPVEHKRAQMEQPHEQGRVLIEEHFPEPLGFLEQMEPRQIVGFPAPLEPGQGMASGPALPAFLATANLVV